MTDKIKPTVLVVDDSPEHIDIVVAALKNSYNIMAARSGEIALKILETSEVPDIILLDIQMPGMDGYQVCRKLKQLPRTEQVPVIFVSAIASNEERLAGYEAGGCDYIIKPFFPDELHSKVELLLSYKERSESLKKELGSAVNMAMVAMSSAGEMGVILQFLSHSFSCRSYTELAKAVLESMDSYQLDAVVQLRGDTEIVNMANRAVVSPLEESVLTELKDQKRIFDFNQRTVVTYPYASLLVKNMPMDNPEMYGRIKDNLGLLMEGTEHRMKAMAVEYQVKAKQEKLKKVVLLTEQALKQIDAKQQAHKLDNTRIMEKLLAKIEESFMSLGLEEGQEENLLTLINDSVNESNNLYEIGLEVDDYMNKVLTELEDSRVTM